MTALLDGRPPGLDALFRPGKTFTFEMPWPAGALAGRTFTATLDAAALTVSTVGDSLVSEATAAQTTTAGVGSHVFTLVETTGGGSEPIVVGTWVGSDRAATSATSGTITVSESAGTVAVTLIAGSANAPIAPSGSLTATSVQDTFESLSGVQQLDIRNYGATPAAARAGIQSALNTAAFLALAGGSVVVWVPPARWQLDAGLVVPNNTTLRGTGDKSILRLDDGLGGVSADSVLGLGHAGFDDLDIENVTAENLVVDGNRANMTPGSLRSGILTTSRTLTRNVRLRNLILQNCPYYGIGLQGNRARFENMLLDTIHIENVGADGIDTKGVSSRNCVMRHIGVNYHGQALAAQAAVDVRCTWTLSHIDIRSMDNDFFADNVGVRFHGENGGGRAPAVGCTLDAVSVATTGGQTTRAVITTGASGGVTAMGNVVGSVAYKRAVDWMVTEGGTPDNATSFQTASITPPPNVLLLLTVANSGTGAGTPAPTVTGCGLTWTQVGSVSPAAINRATMYSAMGHFHTPPTTGPITMDFGGISQTSCNWRLDAIENVSLASDADAIVQSTSTGANGVTALSLLLAAFNHANNGVWSSWSTFGTVVPPTPETGYLMRPGTDFLTGRLISTMVRPDNDTTPGVTFAAATNVVGIGVELRVARP